MTNCKQLFRLHDFETKRLVRIIAKICASLLDVLLKRLVSFPWRVEAGEQVPEQAMEDHLIFPHNFGNVKVSKRPHQ